MAVQQEVDLTIEEDDMGLVRTESPPTPSQTYKPYFDSTTSQRHSHQPRKRHTSGLSKTTAVKTINNMNFEPPTLVLATSITPRASVDDIDDTEDRPATRMDTSHRDTAPAGGEPSASLDQDPSSKPRHSFSIGDMLPSGSSGWRLSRGESLRRKKAFGEQSDTVRHVSSPIAAPPSRNFKDDRRLQRRRNITDPTVFNAPKAPLRLDLTASSGGVPDRSDTLLKSPLPPITRLSGFDIELPGGTPTFPHIPISDSRVDSHGSNTYAAYVSGTPIVQLNSAVNFRTKRLSHAGSDPASTLIGSDGDTRVFTSGDEDSMDFQSDTAYDSLATRATASSHSGLRGRRVETIFDESPHDSTKDGLVPLQDLIKDGSFSEKYSTKSSVRSIFGESGDDDKFSTPVKAPTADSIPTRTIQFQSRTDILDARSFASSPPSATTHKHSNGVQINPPSDDVAMSIEGDDDWDLDDDDQYSSFDNNLTPHLPSYSGRRVSPVPFMAATLSPADAWQSPGAQPSSKRSSIFEWSEQQKSDRDTSKGNSPRPKTVHGKQGNDGRGARISGRRGPSTLHLRSQSVPVTRESNVETGINHANGGKFGTWGLGNKGVSEEWNDDFEFEDNEEAGDGDDEADKPSLLSGKGGMRVPQSIIDRQASVQVQFGQVQELTLLVEELRRLRVHASSLRIVDGPSSSLWKDAEAIINLATLDDEADEAHGNQSPGSTTFGFDEFEDDSANKSKNNPLSPPSSEAPQRRSSIFRRSTSSPATPPTSRVRGESNAQAKSFLQTMYHNRNEGDPVIQLVRKPGDKMPFDTQDLRNLVTRAGVLTRALKEIVRKAEGVSQSPDTSPSVPRDPPFSEMFHQTTDVSSFKENNNDRTIPSNNKVHGLPKSQSAHGFMHGSMSPSNEKELAGRMELMSVV